MNSTVFIEQVKAMSNRLANLYEGITTTTSPLPDLVSSALKELGIASERLQVASEMMHRQGQELQSIERIASVERQRYQALLDFIPDACLVTDSTGVIQEANPAAVRLLNMAQPSLIGRSLTQFANEVTRKLLQAELQQFQQTAWKQEWQIRLQPHQSNPFTVNAFIEADHAGPDSPVILRWLLRPLGDRHSATEVKQIYSSVDFKYPLQHYHRGETIPLEPQMMWQVHSGLVKLSTFADNGQEVWVGLAGASASFSSNLTALPLYEATALADTLVSCIPINEFDTSPELQRQFLAQISQRLKQAEQMLAIYGQPRVADRLNNLLRLLKQEIGQPVETGTRLSVRLTHEDLATACCSTRVTVTRLLSQLQQEKKITVDVDHHLILHD